MNRKSNLVSLITILWLILISLSSIVLGEDADLGDHLAPDSAHEYATDNNLDIVKQGDNVGTACVWQSWYYFVDNTNSRVEADVDITMYGPAATGCYSPEIKLKDKVPSGEGRIYIYDISTGPASKEIALLGAIDLKKGDSKEITERKYKNKGDVRTLAAIGMRVHNRETCTECGSFGIIPDTAHDNNLYGPGEPFNWKLKLDSATKTLVSGEWVKSIRYSNNGIMYVDANNTWSKNNNYKLTTPCSGGTNWYIVDEGLEVVGATKNALMANLTLGDIYIKVTRKISPIEKPTGLSLQYNGQIQTGVISGEGYELTNNTGIDVGEYKATATLKEGYIWSGDNSMENAEVKWSITPKTLTVTPEENQSKFFGEADSTLKYTYLGEVPGEKPNFSGDLSRTPGEWAGEYEINGGNLKLIDNTAEGFQSKNYNLQVKTGKFIIQYGTGTFITKWNVNSDEDIKLPIPKNVNNSYIVDWGDNTYNRYTDEAFPTHRYADNSERTIAIAGIMKEFGHCQDAIPNSTNMYSDYFSQTEHIIEIIQWGVVGATKYGFAHCGNLTGNIPSPASESFKELTSGTFMFKDCSNLRGSIPAEFFKDAGNAEEFKTTFAGCTGLTGEIPGNLFNGCIKAGTFSETFNGCTGLTGTIPEGLFSSCLGAKNFNATFAGCTGLNGAIPENLFGSCTKVQEFNSTFAGCTGLNGAIPEGLFSSCTNANVFRETFANCSNLTSDAKGAVAQNLFANNKNANNFYRTFYGCTNLSGNLNIVLPSLNFDINKEITGNYTSMFEGCTGIEKVILSNIKIGYKMFKDCTGIKELVLSNTEAICGEAFSGCIYLTNINVNDDNLKEIIQGAFYIAGDIITKSIASVPDKLLTSINRESQTLMAYDWLTDNRLVDLDAPKGTVTISQYPFTSSHSLDITIAVVDNYSNEDKCKMAIVLGENYSESLNVESLTWQDYSSTSQIKLQNITEGIKTVWVFFKDEVGNISRIKKEI